MVAFLIEVPDVDVIVNLLQLFSVFKVNIMGIENGELRQCTFLTNSFDWKLCSNEV